MPSKNIVKEYAEGGYYHIYSRGVAKQKIFKDKQDYETFLKYLKEYLSPPLEKLEQRIIILRGKEYKLEIPTIKNYNKEISLLAYCLMPNHFHLLLKQNSKIGIKKFLQSLLTRYSMYFNKRYERVGPLFQSNYKAALINSDEYLIHLSRYIHLNPYDEGVYKGPTLVQFLYSSYSDYLGKRKTKWINTKEILAFFRQNKNGDLIGATTYKSFVEDYNKDQEETIEGLILE